MIRKFWTMHQIFYDVQQKFGLETVLFRLPVGGECEELVFEETLLLEIHRSDIVATH